MISGEKGHKKWTRVFEEIELLIWKKIGREGSNYYSAGYIGMDRKR